MWPEVEHLQVCLYTLVAFRWVLIFISSFPFQVSVSFRWMCLELGLGLCCCCEYLGLISKTLPPVGGGEGAWVKFGFWILDFLS